MFSSEAVTIAVIGLFVTPLAAVVTWVLSRRKQGAETTSSLVSASSAAVTAIHEVMGSLREENAELKAQIQLLTKQNEQFQSEVKLLRAEIEKLQLKIEVVSNES